MSSPITWFLVTSALVFLVALGIAHFTRWRRARAWLSALARNLGIERKPLETDAELRTRCAAVISPAFSPTASGLTKIAVGVAMRYGYPAAVSIDRERGLVSVRVHGAPLGRDLVAIEREIADQLPMTVGLEVVAAQP